MEGLLSNNSREQTVKPRACSLCVTAPVCLYNKTVFMFLSFQTQKLTPNTRNRVSAHSCDADLCRPSLCLCLRAWPCAFNKRRAAVCASVRGRVSMRARARTRASMSCFHNRNPKKSVKTIGRRWGNKSNWFLFSRLLPFNIIRLEMLEMLSPSTHL